MLTVHVYYSIFSYFGFRCIKEMPHKSSSETYVWDHVKEKTFLEKLDEFLASNGGRQPTSQILDLWAIQFNSEFGGVPVYGVTLYQKKRADKKNL